MSTEKQKSFCVIIKEWVLTDKEWIDKIAEKTAEREEKEARLKLFQKKKSALKTKQGKVSSNCSTKRC